MTYEEKCLIVRDFKTAPPNICALLAATLQSSVVFVGLGLPGGLSSNSGVPSRES